MNFLPRQKEKNIVIYAYQRLFKTEDGQIVLKDLMRSCHFDQPSFDPDPYRTAFNEGERHLLLRILKTINSDPEQLLQLIKDNQEKQNEVFN